MLVVLPVSAEYKAFRCHELLCRAVDLQHQSSWVAYIMESQVKLVTWHHESLVNVHFMAPINPCAKSLALDHCPSK